MDRLGDLSRAADLSGMSSLVRVPANDLSVIARVLSTGVQGVIVPQVTSRIEAERVVEAAKVPPLGRRPASGGRRSYGRGNYSASEAANEETIVAVMIEDIEAVERVDEILAVTQVDMFFVAHYDLAYSMGLGSDVENPALVEVYDRAIKAIVTAGKVAAAVVKEPELDKYIGLGVTCFKVPLWQNLFAAGARAYAGRISELGRR